MLTADAVVLAAAMSYKTGEVSRRPPTPTPCTFVAPMMAMSELGLFHKNTRSHSLPKGTDERSGRYFVGRTIAAAAIRLVTAIHLSIIISSKEHQWSHQDYATIQSPWSSSDELLRRNQLNRLRSGCVRYSLFGLTLYCWRIRIL